MESEGQHVELREAITLVSGNTPSTQNDSYWGVGTPWVSAKDMAGYWIDETQDQLTATGAEQAARIVPSGTALILTRGMTLHRRVPICRVKRPSAFNQDVKAVLPNDGVSPRFVPYLLTGNHERIHALVDSAGHGTGRLNTPELLSLRVWIPCLDEQEAIGKFGEAIDCRIDLLHQTHNTLEAIAQALFKSWFVDFDPVRAKAEGREPVGIDSETAALFPSEFEESELGMIPKGWMCRSLDTIAHFLNGLALQKYPPESDSEYLPVIKIAQLRAGHTNAADRASARLKPDYVVEDGDVLFSWSGSLEVEVWCGGRGALNQHLFKVTSTEVPKWFYFFATRLHLPHFREVAAHKATTMGHIQRRHLTEAKIAVPPLKDLEALSVAFESLFDRMIVNSVQAKKLGDLRDTLLPRLISGKLRLPEAGSLIEESLA